jgi:hypothetical protein
MIDHTIQKPTFDKHEVGLKPRPFNSVSANVTFVLTMMLPMGLLFSRSMFLQIFQEFGAEVPQLARIFLDPALPLLLFALPLGVVVKEFAVGDDTKRRRCDAVFATLAIISLVFAWLALGVPMRHLLSGLSG